MSDLESRLKAVTAKIDPAYRSRTDANIRALRRAGGVASYQRLLEFVQDSRAPSEVRRTAAWVLGRLGDREGVPALIEVLGNVADDSDVRQSSARALGELADERGVSALVSALQHDADPALREAAANALGGIWSGRDSATEPLLRALGNRSELPAVRGMAAEALANLWVMQPSNAVINALIDASEHPLPEVQFWSAFALGEVGDVRALPALEHLATTDEGTVPGWGSVREEAMQAAQRIQERMGNGETL